MLLRSPAVRSRWRGISASAHSVQDAFGMVRPDTFALPFAGVPSATRVTLGAPPPEVHHAEVPASRDALPAILRGPLGETLIAMMRARTSEDAILLGRPLAKDAALGPALERALGLAMGAETFPERWGDDATVDWLRARQLDRLGTDLAAKPRWLGILSWLVRRSEHWRAYVPPELDPATVKAPALVLAAAIGYLPIALAAIARMNGCHRTLQYALLLLEPLRLTAPALAAMRTLVLRCALEGEFVPGSLRRLVPKPRAKPSESADAWRTLLLARRALLEHGHVLGAAHLTGALVATDVRQALARALGRTGPRARIPAWGSRALNDKEVEGLRAAVNRPGVRWKRWDTKDVRPWPNGWGGPDMPAIEAWMRRRLDLDAWGTREIFLHDGLTVAAVLALSGHAANAMAVLGATRTPPSLARTRSALAREIHRGGQTLIADLERPWSKDADAIYRQLRTLPEPSLAIDAPYWLLGDQRADLQHALQTSGRLKESRDLRLVLDRADLAAKLSPFWLLREDEDTAGTLIGLVHTIGRQLEPPGRDECLHFLRSRL